MSQGLGALQGHMMPEDEVDELLRERGVGVLAMASGGLPYCIPMSFGYDDDTLYFLLVGHSEQGKKIQYAEQTEQASFLVYDVASDTEWRSAIVAGSLDRITPEVWNRAREAMADNAYRPDLLTDIDVQDDPRVWKLAVETKSGRCIGGD